MADYIDIRQYPGRRMPNVRARATGGYETVGRPDPNEGLEFAPTNPKFGEVGWSPTMNEFGSTLDRTPWGNWLDALSAQGVTGLRGGTSPAGSNQLRGEAVGPGYDYATPLLNDPYYNTTGIGPRYRESAENERQVLQAKPSDVNPASRGAFKGLQSAIRSRPPSRRPTMFHGYGSSPADLYKVR